jgi:hypothetical protein
MKSRARPIGAMLAGATLIVLLASPASATTTSWTLVSTTSLSGAYPYYTFAQVSCVSGIYCLAGGGAWNAPETTTTSVVERWNGYGWAPMAGTTHPGSLYLGVHCFSTSDCWADGARAAGPGATILEGPYDGVFAHWNGRHWVTSPFSPTGGYYAGMACPASNSCFAVGAIVRSPGHVRVSIAHWNGSTWSTVSVPTPAGQVYASLSSVSCASPSWCDAIGIEEATPSSPVHLFGERFRGSSWTPFSLPSPTGRPWDYTNGVQCPSTSFCLTVGTSQASARGAPAALAELWNGKTWTVSALSRTVASGISAFSDLSCRSQTACWSVGWNGAPARPSVAFWNGTSFELGRAAAATSNGDLETVGCTSARCVALGNRFVSSALSDMLGEEVAVP